MKLYSEIVPSFSWLRTKFNVFTEINGALIGAILVIPQGISFSYLTGVPPEHGIYCAILITFVAALLGNSIMMTGPNTATSILIGLSVIPFAGRGSPLFIDYVMILSVMIGVVQLLAWVLRISNLFYLITPAAISGITTGIGFLIMVWSLEGVLGLAKINTSFFYENIITIISSWSDLVNPYALVIGTVTIAVGFAAQRFSKRYWIFLPIFIGAFTGMLIGSIWPQHITEIEFMGSLNITDFQFQTPKFYADYLLIALQLIPAAVMIAFISLTHSLVIAQDLKQRQDPNINLNKEVFAISISNIIAPFFLSFAGAGSFNRTQVNEELNVRTPLAAILTGLFVIVIILSIGPLFYYLPTAVIAGILFLVGFGMLRWKCLKTYWNNRLEFFTFVTITLAVIFLGLIPAVLLAISTPLIKIVYSQADEVKLAELPKQKISLIEDKTQKENQITQPQNEVEQQYGEQLSLFSGALAEDKKPNGLDAEKESLKKESETAHK